MTAILVLTVLSFGTWESIGPEGGDVSALLQSTQDADVLLAISGANPALVGRSADGGDSWEIISSIPNAYAYDLVMTQDGRLVALGSSRTWTSSDGGYSWNEHYSSNTIFYDGVAHPSESGTVYATGYKYYGGSWDMSFYSSTDAGQSWTATPLTASSNSTYGRTIAISDEAPGNILVGGYEYNSGYIPYLFLSNDGGASFTEVTPSGESYYFQGSAIDPQDSTILFAGGLQQLHRSTDGGTSWSTAANQTYSYDISFSPADDNLVLAAGSNRTYRSTDRGQTWSPVYTGLDGSGIQWIVPHRQNSSLAYTGSSCGFFRSSDGGHSWTMNNSGLLVGKVLAMEEMNDQLYMNIQDLGVFRSDIGPSMTWTEVSTPLSCGDFCALVSIGPDTILALEGAG